MTMPDIPYPLSRTTFAGLNEEQLAELRRILLDFKFRRVTALADQFVDEKGWTSEDIAGDATSLQRRPYASAHRFKAL
ncbi:MAG: hypothetical protein IPM82_25650 [Saprospiraceae bacterium]|nr:hypothetical protein [Saprospiraceae bacterium]